MLIPSLNANTLMFGCCKTMAFWDSGAQFGIVPQVCLRSPKLTR